MKAATKLRDSFVEKYRDQAPPWGPIGYITAKRTYARMLDEGTTEEWWQTTKRCVNGIVAIGGQFTMDELETLYHYVFNLKCCFSGRALWQLGTDNIARIGADSLQNCWHTAVNHPVEPFCFTFNQLMLGGGVGFNITPQQVYELPMVRYGVKVTRMESHDVDFIVPDNREGWVELLRRILTSFFYTGQNLTYSTDCIRARGKQIKTFGGTASGSETLVLGVNQVIGILNSRVNHKLRPIDCLDIMNIIGSVVVAGNVRRSAQMAIGDMHDDAFLNAKNWNKYNIPNWRAMSNNTVQCSNIAGLPDSFWAGYEGEGEPYGLFNLDLCRSHGRLGDSSGYRPDPWVIGLNPCGEIPCESFEACNLFEQFLPNLHSREEFLTAAMLGYKVCKTISAFPFSDPIVNEVVGRNHRIGLSVTGLLQSQWLDDLDAFSVVYNAVEEEDVRYSRHLGVKESVKLTTVKPSGTLSLLAGCTAGLHPAYAKYYIRRVRFAASDPALDKCREAGYPIEPLMNYDGSRDLNTMIASFPIETPNGSVLAKDVTAIDQLKMQSLMQTYWADNAVSMTCYYKPEELPDIHQYLHENYDEGIKSASFLRHSEHGFKQAPIEPCSREDYLRLKDRTSPIGGIKDTEETTLAESMECESGACPIR